MRSSVVPLFVGSYLAAASFSACGDGNGVTNPPTEPAPVATVTVTGHTGTQVPGDQIQLTASLRSAAGSQLTERTVTWSSSDEAVATVNETGLVSANGVGTATITATSEQQSGSGTLTVSEGGRVGPEGGTVTAFGGEVRLEMPAGALSAPVSVIIARSDALSRDPSVVGGSGYDLGPAGTGLGSGGQLFIQYAPAEGPSGVAESDLRIHRLINGALAAPAGTIDIDADLASAPITQLGSYAVRRPLPSAPCTAPEYRQFDFWVGSWTVQIAGASASATAPSDITMEPGGCAIFENFANGSGLSLNVYSPVTGSWHQTFVNSLGQRLLLSGGLQGANMVMTGPLPGPPGSFDRWTWTPLSDGSVRQLQEQSVDGGQTVTPAFDGTYVPR